MHALTSGTDMIEKSIVVLGSEKRAWKDDGVERHIIFGHELIIINLLRVLPPSFPLLSVAGSDGEVPVCHYKQGGLELSVR